MTSFFNDYDELCHPKILENLAKFNGIKYKGYSDDEHVKLAIKYLKRDLKNNNVDIHFVHGGTIVNVLGIILSLRRFEGVLSCDTGHIVNTENGSIESTGHQIIQVRNKDGKVTVEELKKAMDCHSKEYCVSIKLVYISNATELGTVYTRNEIEELSTFCKSNGLYLFMDGARIGTALSSSNSDLKMEDLTKYFDIFSIGGTKNGMLMGEALVIVNNDLKLEARKIIKQKGALLAKGYFFGIQFWTMFEDGLYYRLANHAVEMAKKLSSVFERHKVFLEHSQESNLVFVKMPKELADKLLREVSFEIVHDFCEEMCLTRFATTWNTKEEDICNLEKALNRYQ